MHSLRKKWRADHGARALKTVDQIEASIVALDNEDLLDLHDIFSQKPTAPLAELALGEMKRRDLKA